MLTTHHHKNVSWYEMFTQDKDRWQALVNAAMYLRIPQNAGKKVKAVGGSYSTAALRHIVLLPERVPSFISRGAAHIKRCERPLLAKEGTIPGI